MTVRPIGKVVVRWILEGAVVTTMAAKAWWLYRCLRPGAEKYFQGRVNVSLNMLKPVNAGHTFDAGGLKTGQPADRVDMRTLHECALEDMFSDQEVQRKLKSWAERTTKENPFVLVPKDDPLVKDTRLTDQMKNRLSSMFAQSYLQQDLGSHVVEKRYVFALTNEVTESAAKKFRVLLVREDSLKAWVDAMRMHLDKNGGTEDGLRKGPAAIAEGRTQFGQKFKEYEESRMRHLYMLGLYWANRMEGEISIPGMEFKDKVPIADTIFIAMVRPAGADQLEAVANQLSSPRSSPSSTRLGR
jgi:hypothetical protein